MKITAAHITNYMGVVDVRIEPAADSYLLLVCGENDAGKTSTFNAITNALGGKKAQPARAVRDGADKATTVIDLDDGYRIEHMVPKVGEPTLKITGPDGRIARPQEWLKKLLGGSFLDPLAFLTAEPKEQRKKLAGLVGLDLDGYAAERKPIYDERTVAGRLLDQAQAELARLPPVAERPPAARSQAAIRADLDQVDAEQRAVAEKLAARGRIADRAVAGIESTKRLRADLARLQAQLVQQEEQLASDQAAIVAADQALGNDAPGAVAGRVAAAEERRRSLREEAGRAETLARWEAASEAATRQRQRAEDAVRDQGVARDKLTGQIGALDQRHAAALAAAPMPVDGLSITDDGLTLDGIPFEQASKSAQMRCAIAISMAMQPGLKDILIRDGSLIGGPRLAMLHAEAMFADCRLWIERVGEKDEGAIIIRDGLVAGGAV